MLFQYLFLFGGHIWLSSEITHCLSAKGSLPEVLSGP